MTPLDASPAIGARKLRDAFGRFGTGVAVVTAGTATGVTVSTFVPLSLEPPLVAFSLSRSARCLPILQEAPLIGISVLRQDQKRIAANFARPSTATLDGMPLKRTASGALVVRDAVVAFECMTERRMQVGDHVLFVLRVGGVHLPPPAAPLLFFASGYGSFHVPDGGDDGASVNGLALAWG